MEDPLLLLFVSIFLFALGFLGLGALWLLTLVMQKRPHPTPPMPIAPSDQQDTP